MSSAGTTFPGRTWVSSKPPNFVSMPAFNVEQGDHIETSPDLRQTSASSKYDRERPGGNIFTGRTLNTFKKKGEKQGILKKPEGTDNKEPKVRFSDNAVQKDDTGREIAITSVGGVTIHMAKSYEALIAERDALFESDKSYRRRIKQLEEENAQILLDYDGVYKENNILRDKLDKGDDNHIESYQRIFADRQILREAETAYKRRISQLEHDAKEMLTNFESLYSENKILRDKAKKLEERLNAIDRLDDVKKINELEKKVKLLEKTVRIMGYEREELVKVNHEIDNQMYKLREEIAELNKRNLLLDKENEGFKHGFMALGQQYDSAWKDEIKTKTRRQEEEERKIREEHGQFKKNIEVLNKDLHRLEKINVELKTKTEMLEGDKAEFERRFFDLAKASSTRTPSAAKRKDKEMAIIKEQKLKELNDKVEKLKEENMELKTRSEMFSKERELFEKRLEDATKKPRESASAIRQKVETEREIRDLNMHIENFKEKLKRFEIENTDLKDEIKHMEIETKALKQTTKATASDQASLIDSQKKDLNDKIIALNNEIKTLTAENLKLNAEYNALNDKLQEQIQLVKKESENFQQVKAAFQSTLEDKNTSSTQKIQDLQEENNALQVELQILKPKYATLLADHQALKAEAQSLKVHIDDKGNELEELKENIKSNKDVFSELSKSKREAADLRREIHDLNNKFKNERVKLETDLEELLKNQEFMNTSLAELKVRLNIIQEERNDLKKENVILVKANERQAKTITDLESDVTKVTSDGSSKMKSLQDELIALQNGNKKIDKELVQTKQELDIARNERENQVNKLMKQMEKLKTEREIETRHLKDQSDNLKTEVARLKIFEEKMESMESNLQEFVTKLRETEDRNKDITNKRLSNLNQVVKEMKDETLANRIRAAEREQNELEKYKMELEIKQDAINEIRKLKEENHRLLNLLEDKKAAEEAQDEWTKKKNKFNEVIAQNIRLQEENKRLLTMYNEGHFENMKKDLQMKTEQLKMYETKFNESNIENAKLKKIVEDKQQEITKISSNNDRNIIIQRENKRLLTDNKKIREELMQKDNAISHLKELEITKAKYLDSAANNQRLYEENMRLRDTIEKSKDYKLEFQKVKDQEKCTAAQAVKYVEENVLLKNTLQVKETEMKREIELQKERADNLQVRNKRLLDEMAKLKTDIEKKDDIIIKLKALESAQGKLKDASSNATRLYEENQRLRNLLESGGNWKSNFHNAKSLSANICSDKTSAVYVDSSRSKKSVEEQEKIITNKLLHEVKDEGLTSPDSQEGKVADKMKIKPLIKLPEINKDTSSLFFGLTYQEIHKKTKELKGEKLAEVLSKEMNALKSHMHTSQQEIQATKEDINEKKLEIKRLMHDRETLNSEIIRLKKELEIKRIGESISQIPQLKDQVKRLTQENQRLREEINVRDLQLTSAGAPGYHAAEDVGSPVKQNDKRTIEDKFKLSLAENNRLLEENNRLRIALNEFNQADKESVFKDHELTGSMIEGMKRSKFKGKQWAKKNKDRIKKQVNETDDNKLMKIEEIEV